MSTDTVVLDVLIARIEKLWRKANDPGATPAEREAFEAKALSLMERHRIEAAMLNLERDDPLEDVYYGVVEGRYAMPLISMAEGIARAYSCRVWFYNRAYRKELYVFGFRSDAERVVRLAKMLLADAQAQAATYRSDSPAKTATYRRSFLVGYGNAVARRFREAELLSRQAAADRHGQDKVASAALVLVSREEQVVKKFAEKRMTKARSSSAKTAADGYRAGERAGQNAQTGNRSVGATRALPA
jgi:hypothetical protein